MTHRFEAVIALSVTAFLVACSAERADAQEVYRLEQVGGQALPVVLEQDAECREDLLEATLTLEADGEWELSTREQEVCGADTAADDEVEEGDFTVDGQTIRFVEEDAPIDVDPDDDPTEIDVEDLAVGTRGEGVLNVRLRDGRTELLFRRQP